MLSYHDKYLKYKLKYSKLKNLYGGSIPLNLLYYPELSDTELLIVLTHIYRLYNFNFTDQTKFNNLFYDFTSGCERIAEIINTKGIKNLIAPGDSPSKIVKYLEKNNLCRSCKFISFTISDVYRYTSSKYTDVDILYNYLASNLPTDDLDKTMIIDFVARGTGITAIANTYGKKLGRVDFRRVLFDDLLAVRSGVKRISNTRNNIQLLNPTYIINIDHYFGDSMLFLIESEATHTRCISKNNNYEYVNESRFKSYGCDFFVYTAMLYKKYGLNKIFGIINNLKRTLQMPIENFYSNYGSNKLIDLTIYNEDGTNFILPNMIISDFETHGLGNIVVCNQIPSMAFRDPSNERSIPYTSILDEYTEIKNTFKDFKCIILKIFGIENSHSIYNIVYSDRDGSTISVHNMVYVFNYNYLKFIPIASFYRLKNENDIEENYYADVAINIFPEQLISTELVNTLSGESYQQFLDLFEEISKNRRRIDTILITLKDSTTINGKFFGFLDGMSGIEIYQSHNYKYILYYLIDLSKEIIITYKPESRYI